MLCLSKVITTISSIMMNSSSGGSSPHLVADQWLGDIDIKMVADVVLLSATKVLLLSLSEFYLFQLRQ